MDVPKILPDKIIFNKYQIKKLLGEGSYGSVYLAKNKLTNQFFAVKLEDKIRSNGELKNETFLLFTLKSFGIPKIITYGYSGRYNILIEQLLGKNLKELFKTNKNKIKDLCMVAIQIIDRLKYVHSKGIIHRDIKPANFLIGNPDSSTIYIIDFGLSRKYRSSRTGNHVKFAKCKSIPCTMLFSSINASNAIEQTRRDDLESLAYTFVYLVKGKLPWSGISAKTQYECLIKAKKIKENVGIEKLCEGLPKEFVTYTQYVRSLKFDEKPNYDFLRSLFINSLKNINEENDYNFSWIKPNENIDFKALGFNRSLQAIRSIRSRPSIASSRKRLLKNLEKCCSDKRYYTCKNDPHFICSKNNKNENKQNSDDENKLVIDTVNDHIICKTQIYDNNQADINPVTSKKLENEFKNLKISIANSNSKQNSYAENKICKKRLVHRSIKCNINKQKNNIFVKKIDNLHLNDLNYLNLENQDTRYLTSNTNTSSNVNSKNNFFDPSYNMNTNISKEYIPLSKRLQKRTLQRNIPKNFYVKNSGKNSTDDICSTIKLKSKNFQTQNNNIINYKSKFLFINKHYSPKNINAANLNINKELKGAFLLEKNY